MSAASNALATLDGFESLLLNGAKMQSDVSNVLQGATVLRTIEGASTLTLNIYDDAQKLLKSGLFSERIEVQVDDFSFELVQVRKAGTGLTIVFEDLPVAALRRHDSPLKVSANTTTHVQFARRMVKEEAWLSLWSPDEIPSVERSQVELIRGTPALQDDTKENSWVALGRIAEERGWRRFVKDPSTIAYAPDTFLIQQESGFTLTENRKGVETIDFDFDTGKPLATITARVRSARWEIPVGSSVRVQDLGPAKGQWLVTSVSRSLFSLFTEVVLIQPRPELPEPVVQAVAEITSLGVTSGSSGSSQSSWPDDPTNLVKIGQGNHRLAQPAAVSFGMVQQAFGSVIKISDSYRSVASQAGSYSSNPSRFGKPGNSAHGEGRAVDVDLRALGANPQGEPTNWLKDPVYRRLVEAFTAQGWCNYQLKNGSARGRTREPWHFSYQVCK